VNLVTIYNTYPRAGVMDDGGLRLLAAGLGIGIGAAWASGAALRGVLAGAPQTPALALTLAAATMAAVCVAACVFPARRAARLSPMEALARD
jgi:putative ABC transport system permease protein